MWRFVLGLMMLSSVAHAADYVPRPCPPVPGYAEQIAQLKIQGVPQNEIDGLIQAAWQTAKAVPGSRVGDNLNLAAQLAGYACHELTRDPNWPHGWH